mmetsp:Transcript_22387/g.45803  ORF Transcript_22387/g.45803 Transcript_22387/m.45803 type:complete len:277 (+) Transcript_22387:51-881(+)
MTKTRISSYPSGRSPPSSSSPSSTSQTSFSTPHQPLNSTMRQASTNSNSRNHGKDDMHPPSSSSSPPSSRPRTNTSARTVRGSIHRQRHRRRPSPCPLHRRGLVHRQLVATVALALMTALSSPRIYGSSTVLCAADAKTIRGHRELAREGQEPSGEESRHDDGPLQQGQQQKQKEHEEAPKQLREEDARPKTRRKRLQQHQQQQQQQQPQPQQHTRQPAPPPTNTPSSTKPPSTSAPAAADKDPPPTKKESITKTARRTEEMAAREGMSFWNWTRV